MLRILKINQSLPHLEKKRAAPYVPQVAVTNPSGAGYAALTTPV
jgi:hypothetical protein